MRKCAAAFLILLFFITGSCLADNRQENPPALPEAPGVQADLRGAAGDNQVWVAISLPQCMKGPWGDTDPVQYFKNNGIKVYDKRVTDNEVVCAACGCPPLRKMEILIDKDDLSLFQEKMPQVAQRLEEM